MAGIKTRRLFQVAPEQNDGETICNLPKVDKYQSALLKENMRTMLW